MNFLQLVKERYAVRKFSDKKVEREKLDLILEAGRVAPTADNYQPQRILVIDNEDSLTKLKSCTPYHFNADIIKKNLELPEYLVPVALLPIGYPRSDSSPHQLHGKRYDINDTVFFNSFEGITQGKNDEGQHDLPK